MWYNSTKNDLDLVFIYDELMLKELQDKLKLTLEFVSFAYIEGYKLYRYRKSVVAMRNTDVKRPYGNDKIFGSVYKVPKFHYNSLILDGYYYCSKARTGTTTEHDMRDRIVDTSHCITFTKSYELVNHRYTDSISLQTYVYIGNKLDNRLISHINYGRYRVIDGIDIKSYKGLLKEKEID